MTFGGRAHNPCPSCSMLRCQGWSKQIQDSRHLHVRCRGTASTVLHWICVTTLLSAKWLQCFSLSTSLVPAFLPYFLCPSLWYHLCRQNTFLSGCNLRGFVMYLSCRSFIREMPLSRHRGAQGKTTSLGGCAYNLCNLDTPFRSIMLHHCIVHHDTVDDIRKLRQGYHYMTKVHETKFQ